MMNERIKELAEQATDKWVGGEFFDRQKFAELIVRECAEVCMKEIDTGWVMAPKSPWMSKQILDHFGINQ
jgi:hypothetical protein